MRTAYTHQEETTTAINHLYEIAPSTVAAEEMYYGVITNEPLLIMADSLLRYAKAYQLRWDQPVAEDGFLGEHFKSALFGVRALLNGNGASAMEDPRRRESFDGGTLDTILCAAARVGGFENEL